MSCPINNCTKACVYCAGFCVFQFLLLTETWKKGTIDPPIEDEFRYIVFIHKKRAFLWNVILIRSWQYRI